VQAWVHEAKSNLYASPLVADMHPSPGKEIIVGDSEARRLRCISATGQQLWETDGGWKKRLVSAASLSAPLADGTRLLAVGNADGSLTAVDAATGKVRWQVQAGPVEWGGGLWADIDGDGAQEYAHATLKDGVAAYDAQGRERWRYTGAAGGPQVAVSSVPAACDIDGDGKSEMFFSTPWGVSCLNGDGTPRWEKTTGDDFKATIIIGDADSDGAPELYTMSCDDDYLWRLDARTGAVAWKTPLAGGADAYNGSALALGDIDRDGTEEVVAADNTGHVYALGSDGTIRWMFTTQKPVHAAVSLGDVDGDGKVEVLAASGDHNLYCLNGIGHELWRVETGLRLVHPATIDDINLDGKTDLLVCGCDHLLRCLQTGGRYDATSVPWPSRRFDSAQSGASFGKRGPAQPKVEVSQSLFEYGGFEQGKVRGGLEQFDAKNPLRDRVLGRPQGWKCVTPGVEWGMADNLDGNGKCLLVQGPCEIVSDYVPLPYGLRTLSAAVSGGACAVRAEIRWLGDTGVIGATPLEYQSEGGGWHSWFLGDTAPPRGARSAAMALHSECPDSRWDGACITGKVLAPVSTTVLINQAGYDVGAPKHFVVQSNVKAESAAFALLREDGSVAREGSLAPTGRITGKYGKDWGCEYYNGALGDFDTPGRYRIRATLDGVTAESWPFEIGENQLWNAAARPAYRFFWYQRCGMEIPGFHGACHLDDANGPDGKTARNVAGGWHDAGDYNKYQNAPYLIGLARAYGAQATAFDALKPEGEEGFLDELLWGGIHVRRMVTEDGSAFGSITSGYGFWGPPELETDNIPGTGDERPASCVRGDNPDDHQAGLARIAALLHDKGRADVSEWTEPAARSLDYALAQGHRGLQQLGTATDLFRATNDPKYAALAKELFAALAPKPDQGPSPVLVDVVRRYDETFKEDHAAVLKEMLVARAEALLKLSDNPFGVCTFGPPEKPNFFNAPDDKGGWHIGTSSYLFESATLVALADQFAPDPRYKRFVYDQFNWTLGMNPFNLSLMEGVGSAFLPSYHNRIAFAGIKRGAVPGSVVNGMTWRAVGDDRPFVDTNGTDIPAFESNECWLPHNTAFLNALANLMRAGNLSKM
jgi:outer membrane protein assembly factor BamB